MKIIAISDEGNYIEPLWIVTVQVSRNHAVDVKINGSSGLVYIMQNSDGSEVYHLESGKTYPEWPFSTDKAVDLVKDAYQKGWFVKNPPAAQPLVEISTERYKQIAFQAIQLLRKVTHSREAFNGNDWKDTDDWVFSELDLEKQELMSIFSGYNGTLIYAGSCFPYGESPKNYDRQFFDKDIFAEKLYG